MRNGSVEAASALSEKIRNLITSNLSNSFDNLSVDISPQLFWKRVNQIRGANFRADRNIVENIDANSLNDHYSNVSTDANYMTTSKRNTCCLPSSCSFFTPLGVYNQLGKLKRTSPGLDNIPSWFLKSLSPFLAEPLSKLYSASLETGIVPTQWKTANIMPIAKITQPTSPSDFRPISLTPILSRLMEKMLIRYFFYPFFHNHQWLHA